eukprot:CAMPEP_0171490340 /NCGR_PEP_ID=MMETSP0958-20121227/3251_1 /TAXON_ID=87120 /ORGANISM="Aurantiochytrium limacinum, Strain ATCCMYA-1381" /LENGTH=654 /DNA_ID=CAMNT_0012023639 /DNA_START=197 /DNA_END=2158 /DNA_ORIENTATION=+
MSAASKVATKGSGVWQDFATTVWRSAHGKVLLSAWGAYLVWLLSLRRKREGLKSTKKAKKIDAANDLEAAEAKQTGAAATKSKSNKKVALDELIKIIKVHAWSRQGLEFMLYILTLCTRVFITVKLSDLSGHCAGLMGARKYKGLFRAQAMFGLVCMVAAATTASMKFLEKRVAFNVRSIIFEHLKSRYLDPERLRFYHGDLADASARLTTDLDDFATSLVHGVGHFVKPLIDIVHLSAVMGSRLGLGNLSVFYMYFWFSNWSLTRVRSRALPKPLKQCAVDRNRLESELRSSLQGIHNFREQIAMQGGTAHEKASVEQQYKYVKEEIDRENNQYAMLDWLSSYTLKYGGMMVAFSIITPKGYYDHSMSAQDLTEYFFSNTGLLGALASAVKDLADSTHQIPRIRGLAERVYELEANMIQVDRSGRGVPDSGNHVHQSSEVDHVHISRTVVKPPVPLWHFSEDHLDRDEAVEILPAPVLIDNLELDVCPGQHTVIRGANGLGKSSLFRVLTQLWKPHGDNAVVEIPSSLFVLPQESFLPSGAQLRELLTYPNPGSEISDNKALEILKVVGLEVVNERYSLDGTADWSACLSGGQKQRLGWARLFFHCPKFALCDEATAAISKDGIDVLFDYAQNTLGITLLTISHSPQVDAHHT